MQNLETLHVLHAWDNCLVGYSKPHGACNMNCTYCMAGYSAIKRQHHLNNTVLNRAQSIDISANAPVRCNNYRNLRIICFAKL